MNLKLAIFTLTLLLSIVSFSQKIIKKDGVYINSETLNKYSGVYNLIMIMAKKRLFTLLNKV
jgi:hypothetical protein